jgi:hypothetical protein
MKQREYIEGPEATRNFERLASAILQRRTRKKKKKQADTKPASQENEQKSDKG